jgi:hypothetical protein
MTAPVSEYHRKDGESTLQAVLEEIVPDRYWLSEKATAKIAGRLNS